MKTKSMEIEDEHLVSFCERVPLSIERGKGVYVWDEFGNKYLDFTSGWAVTSIGYANSVVSNALYEQSLKIMHNPNSGLTYSPSRAALLSTMVSVLPKMCDKIFFVNSGAEANDAAIKLSRKITGRKKIVSASMSFHGRTLSCLSATGQSIYRESLNVLVPFVEFVNYGNFEELEQAIDKDTAACILEPIQGEGGINVAPEGYLEKASEICKRNGTCLIIDEIQTGFYRTGDAFAISSKNVEPSFITMAKGIASGFPFGAVAVNRSIAKEIKVGDHGGTYNGNPLGCAVANAVLTFMIQNKIGEHVKQVEQLLFEELEMLKLDYPGVVADIRGKGLLCAVEFTDEAYGTLVYGKCLERGILTNLKRGKIIRIFPSLTITEDEILEGLQIIKQVISETAWRSGVVV